MHTYMFNNTVLAVLETVILGKYVNQCSVTIMFITIYTPLIQGTPRIHWKRCQLFVSYLANQIYHFIFCRQVVYPYHGRKEWGCNQVYYLPPSWCLHTQYNLVALLVSSLKHSDMWTEPFYKRQRDFLVSINACKPTSCSPITNSTILPFCTLQQLKNVWPHLLRQQLFPPLPLLPTFLPSVLHSLHSSSSCCSSPSHFPSCSI